MDSKIFSATAEQEEAVERVVAALKRGQKVVKFNGVAGSGKTTTIRLLIARMHQEFPDATIAACAPTNKAALELMRRGIPATTIHSGFFIPVLWLVVENKDGDRKIMTAETFQARKHAPDFDPEKDYSKIVEEKLGFDPKAGEVTFVICDEASMLPFQILQDTLKQCKQLVLVGDDFQLPPVGDDDYPKGFFNELPPDASLTQPMRHDAGSPILELAMGIRSANGADWYHLLEPFTHVGGCQALYEDAEKLWIVATHVTRRAVNENFRRIHNRTSHWPHSGERVRLKETFPGTPWVNGTLCDVENITMDPNYNAYSLVDVINEFDERRTFRMRSWDLHTYMETHNGIRKPECRNLWALQDLEKYNANHNAYSGAGMDGIAVATFHFAYANTCHAAQGGEHRKVVIGAGVKDVERAFGRGPNGAEMVARRWYTAITRAREELVITTRVAP